MKTGIIKNITAKVSALLCLLLLTSCWENFSNEFIDAYESTPQEVTVTSASIAGSTLTLNWDEPDLSTYNSVHIKSTGGTDVTVTKGTMISPVTILTTDPDSETTITLKAIYSTGYTSKGASFKVTPVAGTLHFIYTPAQLDAVPNNSSEYWIVMADLDLSGYQTNRGWDGIGNDVAPFQGTIDGNGYTISNLYINYPTGDYRGLFGAMTNATIKNVHIAGCKITGQDYVGGFAGQIGDNCKISNCSVSGIINGAGNNIGGFTGHNSGQISNCSASVNVSYEGNTTTNTGGFVGLSQGQISDCSASGMVSLTFTGLEAVTRKAGGFCGQTDTGSNIDNCSASGNVYGDLAGSLGGFVGVHLGSSISNCYATGNVSGTAGHAGGFLGMTYNSATIDTCFATGNVIITGSKSGETQVGGFSGVCGTATIRKCYATGNVTGTTYTGGFTGVCDSSASFELCYAIGSVRGTNYAGGFAGYVNYSINITITDCYSTGIISSSGTGYGFGFYTGAGTITVSDCFYNSTTAAGLLDDYAIGESTSDMKLQATYTGWDFTSATPVWAIDTKNDGYPYLKDNPPLN